MDNNLQGPDATSFQVGDPEWIGVLEHPDLPYGPNNHFIARYAFIALPAGNSLDLNAIHNQAHRPQIPTSTLPGDSTVNPPANDVNNPDSYTRNESVGSWELNLAAFLADLNTNQWGQSVGGVFPNTTYYYYQYSGQYNNVGYAFDDARALLAFRYNNSFNTLNLLPNLFPPNGVTAFANDGIDGFTYGFPLMTGFHAPGENDSILISDKAPWVGADNTNRFYDLTADLFDTTKTAMGVSAANNFSGRLLATGTNNSTYNRYTFYRLLAQLGTDTAPESGKMNLNYDNLDPGFNGFLNVTGSASETNFVAWSRWTFSPTPPTGC